MKEKLLSVLTVLLTGSAAVAQENVADTTGCDAGWVWEVSGKGLSHNSYLFGTCHGDGHQFTKEEVFGIAGLEDAFDNVEAVLFEMDMNPNNQDSTAVKAVKEYNDKLMKWIKNPGAEYMMPKGVYYKPLYDSISHFNEVDKYLTKKMKDMEYWKKTPGYWFSVLKIVMFAATRQAKTVEAIMYEETVKRGYKTGGLEVLDDIDSSLDSMFMKNAFLDKLSMKEQADTLYQTIKVMTNGELRRFFGEFSKTYLANDTCAVHRLLGKPQYMEDNEDPNDTLLLRDRNIAWLPAIKENMTARPCMIAVGCRHLLGSDGLIALLRRDGYNVKPVKNK